MSEHEISKHTKVIYKEWRNSHHSWKRKLGEIVTEVLIIVFAITLSLLVERWREHAHEQKIEKQFLIGLRADLKADIIQQQGDSASYAGLKQGWTYYYNLGNDVTVLNADSIEAYQWTLLNNTTFIPNSSRFEALKSSGDIGVIENDSLQNLILDLYQNRIPSLHLSTDMFSNFKNQHMIPYILQNLRVSKGKSNIVTLMQQPVMQNYLNYRFTADEVLERYQAIMQQSRKIIHLIDEEYNLKD